MIDFSGKTLLLTGANGGIPRAIAQLLHRGGATLALTDLDVTALESFARTLDPHLRRIICLRQNVTDPASAQDVVHTTQERFGGIDFLVTGAGIYRDQLVQDMSDEQWRQTQSVNLDGVFYTCRAAIPALRDGASVVNITSIAGHRGSYEHAHYAAAKGGVLSFTRSLAQELAPRVRVNAVSPGFIDTPFIKDIPAQRSAAAVASTLLKRLGRADEVAQAVAFLCSDWSSFITGETVHVNGGLYIAG